MGAFIETVMMPTEQLLLVVHNWGSALGFNWANQHRDWVRGIEAIIRPVLTVPEA